jgi:His-Xaa-Ser system radical SAM maturase HxsC
MLRLYTQAMTEGIASPLLLKVVTLEEVVCQGWPLATSALWVAEEDQALLNPVLFDLPWGACISRAERGRPSGWHGPWVHSLLDRQVIAPGDVIAVRPASGLIRVLYRRGANSNVLFVTERCNSLCLMCSQPPRPEDDRWRVQELMALIPLIDKDEPSLGITGGEPTLLGESLLELIRRCGTVLPSTGLHVLTNGRAFGDRAFAAKVGALGHPHLTWGIPLYADHADLHDYIVQALGAFDETVQGLYALAGFQQTIEIRVVLHCQTLPRLSQLAYYLFRNFPFVAHVAFMGLEPMGLARGNRDILWIDPLDYVHTLEDATYFLANRGIYVSIYNLPLCILPKSLWPFARKSISDWKNIFLEPCQECAGRERCAGFFASASERWQSRGIHPLNDRDVKSWPSG